MTSPRQKYGRLFMTSIRITAACLGRALQNDLERHTEVGLANQTGPQLPNALFSPKFGPCGVQSSHSHLAITLASPNEMRLNLSLVKVHQLSMLITVSLTGGEQFLKRFYPKLLPLFTPDWTTTVSHSHGATLSMKAKKKPGFSQRAGDVTCVSLSYICVTTRRLMSFTAWPNRPRVATCFLQVL